MRLNGFLLSASKRKLSRERGIGWPNQAPAVGKFDAHAVNIDDFAVLEIGEIKHLVR